MNIKYHMFLLLLINVIFCCNDAKKDQNNANTIQYKVIRVNNHKKILIDSIKLYHNSLRIEDIYEDYGINLIITNAQNYSYKVTINDKPQKNYFNKNDFEKLYASLKDKGFIQSEEVKSHENIWLIDNLKLDSFQMSYNLIYIDFKEKFGGYERKEEYLINETVISIYVRKIFKIRNEFNFEEDMKFIKSCIEIRSYACKE